MSRKFLLSFVIVVLAGFAIYKVMFSPVSVTFESHPGKILTNSESPISVEVFPLNRLGLRVPFGHLNGKFVVSEGGEKIDIVREKEDEFTFETRNGAGRLVILYYAQKVSFPVEIILYIENSSLASMNHLTLSLS